MAKIALTKDQGRAAFKQHAVRVRGNIKAVKNRTGNKGLPGLNNEIKQLAEAVDILVEIIKNKVL